MIKFIVAICILTIIFKSQNRHDKCYTKMKNKGIAIFGNCCGLAGGDKSSDYLQYECIDCPYFCDIKEDKLNEQI